jgi:hypothetical protein
LQNTHRLKLLILIRRRSIAAKMFSLRACSDFRAA